MRHGGAGPQQGLCGLKWPLKWLWNPTVFCHPNGMADAGRRSCFPTKEAGNRLVRAHYAWEWNIYYFIFTLRPTPVWGFYLLYWDLERSHAKTKTWTSYYNSWWLSLYQNRDNMLLVSLLADATTERKTYQKVRSEENVVEQSYDCQKVLLNQLSDRLNFIASGK